MRDARTMPVLSEQERVTLACALMAGQPGRWHAPPRELLTRLLGHRLADAVLTYREPARVSDQIHA